MHRSRRKYEATAAVVATIMAAGVVFKAELDASVVSSTEAVATATASEVAAAEPSASTAVIAGRPTGQAEHGRHQCAFFHVNHYVRMSLSRSQNASSAYPRIWLPRGVSHERCYSNSIPICCPIFSRCVRASEIMKKSSTIQISILYNNESVHHSSIISECP